MAKWFGKVGYSVARETSPGVWLPDVVERSYYGDVLRLSPGWQMNSDSTNDDLTVNSQISIVADDFAYQNSYTMKYVEYMGAKWKITKIEPQRPRLILTLGGVWNG